MKSHSLTLVHALAASLALACGGNSSKSKDSGAGEGTSTGSGGGTASSSIGGAGGTSGGNVSTGDTDGGTGGESSGGVSATSGGTGGVGGTDGMGGASGADASSGSGGSMSSSGGASTGSTGGTDSGTGGSGGTGGGDGGPTGVVGTLGQPCDSPGMLACAGNHQKLTLVCGGDGEWEVNQTCGETEYCDSSVGDTTGLCLEPSVECQAQELAVRECVDGHVYSCEPDGLRRALAEECLGVCENGECLNDVEPCPGEDFMPLVCSQTCGTKTPGCPGVPDAAVLLERPSGFAGAVFRTARYSNLEPLACDETLRGHALRIDIGPYRISAPPPWRIAVGRSENAPCDLLPTTCAVVLEATLVHFLTDDETASEQNVLLELVDWDATCPE